MKQKIAVVRMHIVTTLEVPILAPEGWEDSTPFDAKGLAWGMTKTEVISKGKVIGSELGEEVEIWRWEEVEEDESPEGLCASFLAEVKRVRGEDVAAESRCDYSIGWFYIGIARRFGDGSVGTIGPARACRKKEIERRIANLRNCKSRVLPEAV